MFGTSATGPVGTPAQVAAAVAREDHVRGGYVWRRANTRYGYADALTNQTDLFGTFSTGSIKHSIAAGAEFDWEKARRGTFLLATGSTISPRCNTATIARYYCTSLFTPNANDPWVNYASDTSPTLAPIVRGSTPTETQNDGITRSIYAFDSITIVPSLLLNLGGRYDWFKSIIRPGQAATATEQIRLERTDGIFNWQAGRTACAGRRRCDEGWMLIAIPDVLGHGALARVRDLLDGAAWIDGNATSGAQSALAKHNAQLPEDSPAAREAGRIVLDALAASPVFVAAALPLKVFPPLFNRYEGGQDFGLHVDNAIRIRRGSDFRIRSDLSVKLFLAEPESYEGGELVVEDLYGPQRVKLPAGHMVLYPASSLHRVEPVTRGRRVASFFWIQSMVRDDGEGRILFDLDRAVQSVAGDRGQGDAAVVQLTGVYHNLLRRWADA